MTCLELALKVAAALPDVSCLDDARTNNKVCFALGTAIAVCRQADTNSENSFRYAFIHEADKLSVLDEALLAWEESA